MKVNLFLQRSQFPEVLRVLMLMMYVDMFIYPLSCLGCLLLQAVVILDPNGWLFCRLMKVARLYPWCTILTVSLDTGENDRVLLQLVLCS